MSLLIPYDSYISIIRPLKTISEVFEKSSVECCVDNARPVNKNKTYVSHTHQNHYIPITHISKIYEDFEKKHVVCFINVFYSTMKFICTKIVEQ